MTVATVGQRAVNQRQSIRPALHPQRKCEPPESIYYYNSFHLYKTDYLHSPLSQQLKVSPRVRQTTTRRKAHTLRLGWEHDEHEDGRRLASDPTIVRTTPRLERQEAFRAPQTWGDVVLDDAALYRLGILYDDDDDGNVHAQGSTFCLDTIVHTEPIYSLRPAKRAKKAHDSLVSLGEEGVEVDLDYNIDLITTSLGDDAVLRRFLGPVSDEEPARLRPDDYDNINRQHNASAIREGSTGSLSIIYEFPEILIHSLAPVPAASGFLDLVSDAEEDDRGWALVPGFSDNVEEASPVGGVWVFLAGDDS
ncbi:hypothetical protein GQX73_g2544 [Xylaria multiplex]|uniref:Uncharacterized protein n=1 Tax=Xylaria multiplex TaxID=323545 RepID=A0A7C8IWS9_9PEZI|nr:hypothetical protein GQX73_g2544 [Xylaria multiplex]